MFNVHLYEMAKVREQEFQAQAARHQARRDAGGLRVGLSRLVRRGDRSQH